MSADLSPAPTPTPPATPAATGRRCENCGASMYGEHCHACGQPVRGLVRHFSSVLGDFFDTVFNVDSRVLRTIGPLLTRPGFLSLEYFAGRRVRYVTPMRLFLFLSLLAFFAIQASIDVNEAGPPIRFGNGNDKGLKIDAQSISQAKTPAEVRVALAQAQARMEKAREQVRNIPGADAGIIAAREALHDAAADRIKALESATSPPGVPVPDKNDDNNIDFPINGKPWDPVSNPVDFAWLPGFVNTALNKRMGHARDVLKGSNSQKPLIDAMFNVLPQTLIVLMPLFALMLKIAYWFKRRLYMEHLIVALHSHGFIALALTLVMGVGWYRDVFTSDAGFWHEALGWMRVALIWWIPIYLLVMQKRVYAQGWLMTLVKFGVLGICYAVLLGAGLVVAVLVGLLTL